MLIHIARAGLKLGSFSVLEVRQGLASGRFYLTDLGWKEGMAEWAPLLEFSEFAPEPSPMPPLPAEPEAEPAAQQEEHAGVPWERRHENGFFFGFFETVWMVLFNPSAAFARMRIAGGMADPMLFNLIGGWLGLIACGIYFVVSIRLQPASAAAASKAYGLFNFTPEFAMDELKFMVVMGPVIVTVGSIFCAAVAHLLLMLCGGANKAYHVTLRVFCYSYGSAQLLQLIPVCGNLLAPMWLVVACVVGLAMAHGTTTARSLASMALFLAVSFVCCFGILMLGAKVGS